MFFNPGHGALLGLHSFRVSLPNTYNELHILSFSDMSTGKNYDYVWSYPGDNEYGIIYDDQGLEIAEIGDGDLYCL